MIRAEKRFSFISCNMIHRILVYVSLTMMMMVTSSFANTETDLDKIIRHCKEKSEHFFENEEKYADTRVRSASEPARAAPNEEFQYIVYEKQKHQKTFECITDHTHGFSPADLAKNRRYRELVHECRSEQSQPSCHHAKDYRTFDGTCNNLQHPKYGSALSCLRRIMAAHYDGAAGMRKSVDKKPLPEPRELSLKVHEDKNRPERHMTHIAPLFGQFLSHDISDTALYTIGGSSINCCSQPDDCEPHPMCAPILIRTDDPFYCDKNFTCISARRSAACDTCSVGKRQQINVQSSYIDLSTTYGATESVAKSLRTDDKSGKLKVQWNQKSGDLMPPIDKLEAGSDYHLFLSGDRRVNQHSSLMSIHTLFLREHNRISEILKKLNPKWNGEELFQEARKINTAQYQCIVYKEFLPTILSANVMTSHDLWVSDHGRTEYDPSEDAGIFAEFNTAAYRMHSTINKNVAKYRVDGSYQLFRNTSARVSLLYDGKMSSLMKGECLSPAQKYDRFVAIDLTGFLYAPPKGPFGLDIASFNIQRGRDHGLPTYAEMVHYLWGVDIRCFSDLECLMDKKNIEILQDSYRDACDIDLWVGMNNERVHKGSIVGPTAEELIARQFSNLKYGDRFYFEHPWNFSYEQLQSIRKASLSRIMCSNTNVKEMQLRAHIFPSKSNPVRCCEDIEEVDLSCWKV